MLCFINSIKVKTITDFELRPLSDSERQLIIPLFYIKGKSIAFNKIAKKIAGKSKFSWDKEHLDTPYKFNYAMDTPVSTCPVTASLRNIFGEDWLNNICETYTLAQGKTAQQVMDDVWHALYSMDDDKHLVKFAIDRLQLSENDAIEFSKIKMPQQYGALSLKAIRNILPYLRDYHLTYDKAVFMARLDVVVPSRYWDHPDGRQVVIDQCIEILHRTPQDGNKSTIAQEFKKYLKELGSTDAQLDMIYHPSMVEVYAKVEARGITSTHDKPLQLGDPRTSSVRNPMAMHSMYRLRAVVNTLLSQGKIDADTIVHIEFGRELNDANRRAAIKHYQREQEKKHNEYREKIAELYKEQGINREPSSTDILKYQLWEEQEHICIYTGKKINLTDFLCDDPLYDIEHTIPRSRGGDTTQENLTLCDRQFNRTIKRTHMPVELPQHEEILQRIAPWQENVKKLEAQLRRLSANHPADKESKDDNIEKKHLCNLKRNYWRGKCRRFEMELENWEKEESKGFSRRQGTDNSVIARYGRLYLQSLFNKVYVVRGISTSDFRKAWGLQEDHTSKERVNHVHHAIDAIVIACISPKQYKRLADYYRGVEIHKWDGGKRPTFKKPWNEFTQDVLQLYKTLLVSHHTRRTMGKHTRKQGEHGVVKQGDTARGSLHADHYYGAINVDGTVRYVLRRPVDTLSNSDIDNVVDPEVQARLRQAVSRHKTLKEAVAHDDVWMNKEKGVRIGKVRVFANDVKRPLHIRQQRDLSRHDYKRSFHVKNEVNYMLAIYEGVNEKGKKQRRFELVNNIKAAQYFKRSSRTGDTVQPIVPDKSPEGYPLHNKLQMGTQVLLYENSPEEVWNCTKAELVRRLYKVTGLSVLNQDTRSYGVIDLTHHQEARRSSDVKAKNGAYVQGEDLRPRIKMLHTQINALVAGVDFNISETGEITRLT